MMPEKSELKTPEKQENLLDNSEKSKLNSPEKMDEEIENNNEKDCHDIETGKSNESEKVEPNKTYIEGNKAYRTNDKGEPNEIDINKESENYEKLKKGDLSVELQPNSTYKVDGHEYKTDNNGRIYIADRKFVAQLRDTFVIYQKIELVLIDYTKCSREECLQKRKEFEQIKKQFLKELASDTDLMKKNHFTSDEINMMRDGRVPIGYQVHHIKPLDDSGTNTKENLVLIKNEPYHKGITNYISGLTRNLEVGESISIQIPTPNDSIYIGDEKYE